MKIQFVDRSSGTVKNEKVYGDTGVKILYETYPGYLLERSILSHKPLSKIYGFYNDSRLSSRRIPTFIKEYEIPMDSFEVPSSGFRSFNEFFIRKYKNGLRPFPSDPKVMGSPAEGRVFVYDQITNDRVFPIKGQSPTLSGLLENEEMARRYKGGVGIVVRLCPVDYHRYHFPDSGEVTGFEILSGKLHSVNPTALHKDPLIFQKNERHLTYFKSQNFGTLALLEVGALCVGKMVQTFNHKVSQKRGEEKGYFVFGASTMLILVEPGVFKPDADLLANTAKGLETYIRLGERLGVSL